MSGAGRGTPRISPLPEFSPISPGYPEVDPPERVVPVTNGKFYWTAPGTEPLQLTGVFQGLDGTSIPSGLTRIRMDSTYTAGAVAGRFQYYVEFDGEPVVEPSDQNNADPIYSVLRIRQVVFESVITTRVATLLVVPPNATLVRVFAREVGAPATPGSFIVNAYAGDNLAALGYYNNVAV